MTVAQLVNQIPRILWKPRAVQPCSRERATGHQFCPPRLFKINFNIILHLRVWLPFRFIPSEFQLKFRQHLSFDAEFMTIYEKKFSLKFLQLTLSDARKIFTKPRSV